MFVMFVFLEEKKKHVAKENQQYHLFYHNVYIYKGRALD